MPAGPPQTNEPMITVRYFAAVREQLGSQEEVNLQQSPVQTVGELLACLQARSAKHARALQPGEGLRMACNLTLCDADQRLVDGDEVAFFPPVTGG